MNVPQPGVEYNTRKPSNKCACLTKFFVHYSKALFFALSTSGLLESLIMQSSALLICMSLLNHVAVFGTHWVPSR